MSQELDKNICGRRIAVVGLGISNISVIGYVLRNEPQDLVVFDTRENPPHVDELPEGLEYQLGPLSAEELSRFDLLILSPGLSVNTPEIVTARRNGVEVIGDVELFARAEKGKVIGISGSNGKSTVTTLVNLMATTAGLKSVMAANIGIPVFDALSDEVELYVLELSSFELETTEHLELDAGVILNVSEDHLDRYHGDIEEYAKTKQRMFKHCKTVITNRDDRRTFICGEEGDASFGLDDRSYGRLEENGETWLTVKGEKVLNVREMVICGVHNELNALAAMALADAVGIPREAQLKALRTFPGLEHRCQLVRVIDGVSFYNDSKATNVASTEAAIRGLCGRHPEGMLILAGGLGKGQDFTPLKKYLGDEVSAFYCFGRDGDKLLALDETRCKSALNLRQALRMAIDDCRAGQAIVLSPACASFDQFKGFEDRGHVFVSLVGDLGEHLK